MVAIEKGIPIPPRTRKSRVTKWPFAELEVGDSFLMTGVCRGTAYSTVQSKSKRFGREFCHRAVEGGFRIWRVS
jgi:hypothetical protein